MSRHDDAWIDQATISICTRCTLDECDNGSLSPSHQQKIRELKNAPPCAVNYAIYYGVELDKAAEIGARTLNPDKPESLLVYQQEINHVRTNGRESSEPGRPAAL
jgi:hypothetical protein